MSLLHEMVISDLLQRLLALFLLLILSPLLLAISLIIYLHFGVPVLFLQQRPGLHGRPFLLVKFRTMTQTRDAQGALHPDRDRLTPLGKWLRRSSVDELPELFNILRGEMAFVGPRPLFMEYLPLYTSDQARRHNVRPGLTGWAQVQGRNALSWEEKFRLDAWYVDHRNVILDLRILWLTLATVLERKGISSVGEATVAPFTGS